MIGASIFTIFGIGVTIAGPDLPLAFLLSSALALMVGYSYARLSSRITSNAGPIEFILQGETLNNEILTDGDLSAADIELSFAEQLRKLGPWGQHFPEPLFEGRFVVEEQRVVGGSHLKMMLRPVDGHSRIDAIAFGCLPEDLPDSDTVRLVYKLDVNHFRGHKTCQIMVEQIMDEPG